MVNPIIDRHILYSKIYGIPNNINKDSRKNVQKESINKLAGNLHDDVFDDESTFMKDINQNNERKRVKTVDRKQSFNRVNIVQKDNANQLAGDLHDDVFDDDSTFMKDINQNNKRKSVKNVDRKDKVDKSNILNLNKINSKQYEEKINTNPICLSASPPELAQLIESKKTIQIANKEEGSQIQTLEQMDLKTFAKLMTDTFYFISMSKTLYYFNQIRYQAIDEDDLKTLFMKEIDMDLMNAKSFRPFRQLFIYLLVNPLLIKNISEIDQYKCFSVLDNIVIDVKEWKFYDHSPDRLILSSVRANFKENPSAPIFSNFLSQITNDDPILITRMWEFIGYLLIQSSDAKVIFVMGIASNSGKSMLCRFLASLFDEEQVCNLSINDFDDKFSSGQIIDKVLNISPDLPTEPLSDKAIGIIKSLTGDDKITTNEKYKRKKPYRNRAKFVFTTNHPLRLPTNDIAFWERVVILPFLNSVPKSEQNWDLQGLFEEEKDDIVSIALWHCHKLIKNNYVFSTNLTIKSMKQKWMNDSNGFIDVFLSEKCIITGNDEDRVLMSEMYAKYSDFCFKYDSRKVGEKVFSSYIESRVEGVNRIRYRMDGHNPHSCCSGVKIRDNNKIVIQENTEENYIITPVRKTK